jgi:hypothetical protein
VARIANNEEHEASPKISQHENSTVHTNTEVSVGLKKEKPQINFPETAVLPRIIIISLSFSGNCYCSMAPVGLNTLIFDAS